MLSEHLASSRVAVLLGELAKEGVFSSVPLCFTLRGKVEVSALSLRPMQASPKLTSLTASSWRERGASSCGGGGGGGELMMFL